MSDISHGPDWWKDEKGKWYPPSDIIRSEPEKEVSAFTTEPDSTGEITEGNIVSHFKERYGMDSQVLDPEMIRDLRKAKEDTEWAPSKGKSKVRFMKPQTPSDMFSGLIALGAGIVVVISAFLDWATAGGSLSEGSVSAIEDSNGVGILCFGLIVCLLSALLLRGKRKRWVGLAIIICGVFLVILMLFSLIDITNTSDSISEDLIMKYPDIDAAYANEAKLDIVEGLWVAFGGSVAIFLAGISGLKRHI
mgnify:FL=1|tara:strand:- start:1593 stop:2339 length:747 start_codon:yes stop_codon:yes gene_type:complete